MINREEEAVYRSVEGRGASAMSEWVQGNGIQVVSAWRLVQVNSPLGLQVRTALHQREPALSVAYLVHRPPSLQ